MIDVALVGCGHMGRHHARIVSEHPECRLVATVDALPERARALADRFGAEARESVPEAVEAVLVATPTTTHVDVATPHVRAGRWCLVEKPVAPTAADAARLTGPRTWVGHSERHSPVWRGEAPRRWRHVEVTRIGPASGRCRDVDAILDLMSHDLDLLRWGGRPPGEVRVEHVETAENGLIDETTVHLTWADGATARLVASRRARRTERRWRLYDRGHYRQLDLAAPLPGPDALTHQWSTFVDAIAGRAHLPWSFDEAIAAVAACERVQRAATRFERR